MLEQKVTIVTLIRDDFQRGSIMFQWDYDVTLMCNMVEQQYNIGEQWWSLDDRLQDCFNIVQLSCNRNKHWINIEDHCGWMV